jgi:hypothetical protein
MLSGEAAKHLEKPGKTRFFGRSPHCAARSAAHVSRPQNDIS